jgi:PAS domain S-box-containing protein
MEQKELPLPEPDALRAVVEGVEAETGERLFASLVRHLAVAMSVQYAFVSELSADRKRFRTRALWGRGRYLDNLEFPVEGTPCQAVLNGEMSHHPARLQELFPRDEGLRDWRAESYCGVPLLDSTGKVVGHLAILDDKPMTDPRGLAIMRIFAARARAEIERLEVENSLRESEARYRMSEERLSRIVDSAMDAIITFDRSGCVELFNDAAEKIFGCNADEVIGASVDRFLTPAFQAALEGSLDAFERGEETHPYVWAPGGLTARRVNGTEFPIEATISRAEVGGRRLYTLILRDLEERRRAERVLQQLHLQNEYLQEEIRSVHNVDQIVGQSPALQEALKKVDLVAGTNSSVLILGETGTGKELIARAVHAKSRREERPLIKVNCAALPSGLIESELFGHEKGAFTGATEKRIGRFELADGGTIFLDEIGDISPDLQAKLLRVLQEREFERVGGSKTIRADVRVIAATNRDLARAVAEGRFRQDLYYRLNVFPIPLLPLRERKEDIPLLVHYFVARFAAKIGRTITRVPKDAMRQLIEYEWPGNVRELENVIERAVILSSGPDLMIAAETLATPAPEQPSPKAPPQASLEDVERTHIISVLKRTGWRIDGPDGAARTLNLHPSTLRSRIKKLGIRRSAESS